MTVTNSSWIDTVPKFESHVSFYFRGAVALSQGKAARSKRRRNVCNITFKGFLLSSMLWSATVIRWLDREYLSSSVYLLLLAILSWSGLIHSFRITKSGIENFFVGQSGEWIAARSFTFCYFVMCAFSFSVYVVRRYFLRSESPDGMRRLEEEEEHDVVLPEQAEENQ